VFVLVDRVSLSLITPNQATNANKQLLGTKDSLPIKMAGGPDGDVCGNEPKISIREYGDNVKVVGVADHSGCAEDPDGLAHGELLQLFHEQVLCISNFNKSNLGQEGVLHTVETGEGVKASNSTHNRLQADAFLPCGGRPNSTIDSSDYKQFLNSVGTPNLCSHVVERRGFL
jgi:glutamate dehydrogenase